MNKNHEFINKIYEIVNTFSWIREWNSWIFDFLKREQKYKSTKALKALISLSAYFNTVLIATF